MAIIAPTGSGRGHHGHRRRRAYKPGRANSGLRRRTLHANVKPKPLSPPPHEMAAPPPLPLLPPPPQPHPYTVSHT
jgi:hypothetical protein